MQRIIILANGELPDLDKAQRLMQDGDYIICADGGTRHALALGFRPDLIVGDLDSTGNETIQKYRGEGVEIASYSHDKDETDLELAIHWAIELNPKQIVIVAALGGRLDHTLANITLLVNPRLAAFDARLDDGVEEVLLCRDGVEVHGGAGDLVSLIPWQGAVSGVQTMDLKWPLYKETLYPDNTRGVSNEMLGETASVTLESGLLLVVHRRV